MRQPLGIKFQHEFLSTPSARRATKVMPVFNGSETISIHALREEGDPALTAPTVAGVDFYPRPPRGGRPTECPKKP